MVFKDFPTLNIRKKFKSLPQAVLGSRLKKGKPEVLIHWQGLSSPPEATWEDCNAIKKQFPEFTLDDKGVF